MNTHSSYTTTSRSLCTAHCQRTCGLLFIRWARALYVLCLPLQSSATVRAFAQKLSCQAFDASEAFTFCFDATSKPQWTVVCLQVQSPLLGRQDMLHTLTCFWLSSCLVVRRTKVSNASALLLYADYLLLQALYALCMPLPGTVPSACHTGLGKMKADTFTALTWLTGPGSRQRRLAGGPRSDLWKG